MEDKFTTVASYRSGFIGIGKECKVKVVDNAVVISDKNNVLIAKFPIPEIKFKRMQWAVLLYQNEKLAMSLNFRPVRLNPLVLLGIMTVRVGDISGFINQILMKGAIEK